MAMSRRHVPDSYSRDQRPSSDNENSPAIRRLATSDHLARICTTLKRWAGLAAFAATTTVTLGFSGCCQFGSGGYGFIDSIMDQQVSCWRDHIWAKRAFHLRYGHCGKVHADHFQDGFLAGYCNVCDGGSGECPAMPPERYWGFQYQTQEGAEMQNAWFAGFEAGAGAGKSDGAAAHHDIQISRQMEQLLLEEEALKYDHAGIRKEQVVGTPVSLGDTTTMQDTFEGGGMPQMITPMANSPMAVPQHTAPGIPEESWRPASVPIQQSPPMPMQLLPQDVPVISGSSQR
jgi:hypothetical protein